MILKRSQSQSTQHNTLLKKVVHWCAMGISFLVLITFFSFQGLVFWLNSESGTNWIETKIQTALADTPYSIEIKKFKQSRFLSLGVESLRVNQSNAMLLEAHNLRASIGLFSLLNKTLRLKISADNLDLIALPAQQKKSKSDSDPIRINLTDYYFKQLYFKTSIDKLTVSQSVAGESIEAAFYSNHHLLLSDHNIYLNNNINFNSVKSAYADFIPKDFITTLNINTDSARLVLNELEANNKNYKFLLKGSYDLNNTDLDASFNISIDKSFQDFTPLKTLHADGLLSGNLDRLTGKININTAVKDYKLLLNTPLVYTKDSLQLTNIHGALEDMPISGDFNIALSNYLIDGKINLKSNNLKSVERLLDTSGLAGAANVDINLSSIKNKKQQLAIKSDLTNVNYDSLNIKSAKIFLDIADIYDSSNKELKINAQDLSYADTKLQNIDLDIKPNNQDYDFSIKAKEYTKPPFSIDGKIEIIDLQKNNIKIKSLLAKLAKGNLSLTGDIKENYVNFDIQASKLNLASVPLANLDYKTISIDKGSVIVSGTMDKPVIHSQLQVLTNLTALNSTSINSQFDYTDKILYGTLVAKRKNSELLNGKFNLPLSFSLQPYNLDLSNKSQINGTFKSHLSIENIIQEVFNDIGITLTGTLDSNITMGGTVENPLFNGFLKLSDASFYDASSNTKLKRINGEALFEKDTIHIKSFSARDKHKGELNISGTINFLELTNPQFDLKAKLKSMKLAESKMLIAAADADISFVSNDTDYLLSGTIEPIEVLLDLTDIFNQTIPQLNVVSKKDKDEHNFNKQIKLDLIVDAKNRVFVRGLGLDAELGGKLVVTGFANEPDIQGKLSSLRGRYEEFGKQFTIKNADLLFQGKVPPSPYLDILAQTRTGELLSKIAITGYLEKPQLTLSSEPSMPQDQILARMMFGQDLRDVSPLQALQITQSIRKLSGKSSGSSFDPLGKLRSITKLDDITVEGVGTENTKVGAGKYLSDKVYVKIEQGKTVESGTANLEVEVTDNIYLESKMGANGNVGAGISWGWDY